MRSILGIRHHGPGSGRSVERALEALQPDAVCIEGPPEADALIPLCTDPGMRPPVALLVYAKADPSSASFYPFCDWSPEWRAMRWAVENGRPVRFVDLPRVWALKAENGLARTEAPVDALGLLAATEGHPDGDGWWEAQVELRGDDTALFEAVLLAMGAVREAEDGCRPTDPYEARREAYMRVELSKDERAHGHVAMVCGAWHAPALLPESCPPLKDDRALLKGFKKERIEVTWVPWAASRLSLESGYGAGMAAPAWYQAIWEAGVPELGGRRELPERWLSRTAGLLRARGHDVSSAHVIEATRLAESLAALRGAPQVGLAELRESSLAVFGLPQALASIRGALEVGHDLGQVPDSAPILPLQADIERLLKKGRLSQSTAPQQIELDVRKPSHKLRSQTLRRLGVLGIPFGKRSGDSRGDGSFRETWDLQWDPGFAVQIVTASSLGNTLESAAAGMLRQRAQKLQTVWQLAALLEDGLMAELPAEPALKALDERAAVAQDIQTLMEGLPPLARLLRYGSTLDIDTAPIAPVLQRLYERVVVGLPRACTGIDETLASALGKALEDCHRALALLEDPDLSDDWTELLFTLSERETIHPQIRGKALRKLLSAQLVTPEALQERARQALNQVVEPLHAAQWLEGLIGGSGLLLIHQQALWEVLDTWLGGLASEDFQALLPLLRRAFSGFSKSERRQMGQRLSASDAKQAEEGLDVERASWVHPVLRRIVGSTP
ncbi:MAG: DUF5682 family protein [Myxococcota bacterium]|nr:DUF5682 family protein [Myxococcota bacterium]